MRFIHADNVTIILNRAHDNVRKDCEQRPERTHECLQRFVSAISMSLRDRS